MRRGRKIGWIIFIAALVAVLSFVVLKKVLVVRSVLVEGNTTMSNEEIVRTARIGFGTSVLSLDEEAIRKRVEGTGVLVLEGLRVDYPNTVYLTVRERKPVAMVLHLGQIRVLDAEGCVVSSASSAPDMDLIFVNEMRVMDFEAGKPIRADEAQLEAYCTVVQNLLNQGANVYVSEIELGDVNDLMLVTRAGVTVKLGDGTNMENKIAWMKSAVQDLELRGEGGGTLDVSSGSKADYNRSGSAR